MTDQAYQIGKQSHDIVTGYHDCSAFYTVAKSSNLSVRSTVQRTVWVSVGDATGFLYRWQQELVSR